MTPPAAAAAPAVRPRRAPAPRGPRRVSGPARPVRPAPAPRPARSGAAREHGLALGFVSAFEALAQHRLLDRLIRGRTWIGIIAFALIGIVALQLGLLKLNGGIGRALEREGLLQRQNAALSIENSELAAGERVEARAAKLGMTFVSAGALRFLDAGQHGGHAEAAKAAASLSSAARASAAAQASEAPASSTSEASSEETEASATTTSGESSESESSTAESGGEASAQPAGEAGSASSEAAGSGSSEADTAASVPSSETSSEEAQPSGGSQASPGE